MRTLAALALLWLSGYAIAQPEDPAAIETDQTADTAQAQPGAAQPPQSGVTAPASKPAQTGNLRQQPKRILGVMPNYRAVSAGAIPPPPTPKEAFRIATQNSFDYSAFLFNGITSLEAWGTDAHPQLRSGIAGYGRYYWRGFADRTDGNYMVLFALPTILHEDERYYSLGEGGVLKRSLYAASRTLVTPNYHGHNTFNASEILGRAIAQSISMSYYPPGSRTLGDIALKFGYAVGRDTLTNVFREFWPDISAHLLHRHKD